MIIECPQCGTKNSVAGELIPNKIYRCGNCNSIITILKDDDVTNLNSDMVEEQRDTHANPTIDERLNEITLKPTDVEPADDKASLGNLNISSGSENENGTRINPTLRDAVGSGDLAIAYKAIKQESDTPDVSRNEKNKTTAVLLAVFFTWVTWLYTYKKDGWKLWVGAFVEVIVSILYLNNKFILELFIVIPIWIWAVVDTATKSDDWYKSF